jgi:hypothetical protein
LLTRRSRGTTVGEVYRKVMGDAPLAYVETVGGVRVSDEDVVSVGKNDVSFHRRSLIGLKRSSYSNSLLDS